MDKERKVNKKSKVEYEEKVKALNEKINTLQTNLENTKTDLSFLHKQKKGWVQDRELMDKEVDTLKRKLQQRESDFADKEAEARKLREDGKEREDERNAVIWDIEYVKEQKEREAGEIERRIAALKEEKLSMYEISKFDTEFLSLVMLAQALNIDNYDNKY